MKTKCTSKAAYLDHVQSGKASNQTTRIYRIVKRRANMSLQEIKREYLKQFGQIELSSVSARVNEMKHREILQEEISPRKCTITKITINAVRIM